jgi:hypothetical protein
MTTVSRFVVVIGTVLLIPWSATAADLAKPILDSIRKASPTGTVLQPSEMNVEGCFESLPSPGLVRGDFNGDSREDVAVLLKTRVTDDVKTLGGREFRRADFMLVILLNDGHGGYHVRIADKFSNYVPINGYISIRPPGKVRPSLEEKDIVIRNPTVALNFCERSETIYTVTGTRVRKKMLCCE